MEPPPFSDGNAHCWTGGNHFLLRFNGATAFRQWKQGSNKRDCDLRYPASMGPPPFGSGNKVPTNGTVTSGIRLQWGHRLSAVETRPYQRIHSLGYHASMGPPPFGSGNMTSSWPCGIFWMGFNGATAFRQWKRRERPQHPQLFLCASMGPPPFGSGNERSAQYLSGAVKTLQWGHRLSAVETRWPRRNTPQSPPSFNGATAFRQWKHQGRPGTKPRTRRFNGATAFRQWKLYQADAIGHRLSAWKLGHCQSFNGATAFRQWKRPAFPHVGTISMGPPGIGVLQWGHRLSAVETLAWEVPCRTALPMEGFNGATAFRQWKPLFVP